MAGVAAASAIAGGIKSAKAKKEAAKLAANRPQLSDSPYLRDNIKLAQSELANGMSSSAERAYEQGMDRTLSSSIGAVLQGGGTANNIADIFDSSQVGQQRMALMRDNLRMNQIQQLSAAGGASEMQRQQRFQFNEFMPWADNAQAASAARAQGQQQMWNGISSLGSTVAGGIASMQSQKQLDSYFNNGANAGNGINRQQASNFMANNNNYIQSGAASLYQTPYAQPKVSAPAWINPNYANGMLR